MSVEDTYERDKKYLHKTLESNVTNVEKLNEKLSVFQLEVSKSIAVIQAKLLIYATVAGFVSSSILTIAIAVLSK